MGDPPVGQHVIADRTLTGVYLSPSEQDGVPSNLLVTGPLRDFPPGSIWSASAPHALDGAALSDLYAVPYVGTSAVANGFAGWQPAAENFVVSYQAFTGQTIPTDSLGRLVFVQYESIADLLDVKRVDLATRLTDYLGIAEVLPNGSLFAVSPARTRVYSGNSEGGTLCDLAACRVLDYVADNPVVVYSPGNFAFVGEDFYYADQLSSSSGVPGGNLNRIKPQAEPEWLLSFTGTVSFQPILDDGTPQLLLSLATDTGDAPFALLDTDTLNTSSLPADKGRPSSCRLPPTDIGWRL